MVLRGDKSSWNSTAPQIGLQSVLFGGVKYRPVPLDDLEREALERAAISLETRVISRHINPVV